MAWRPETTAITWPEVEPNLCRNMALLINVKCHHTFDIYRMNEVMQHNMIICKSPGPYIFKIYEVSHLTGKYNINVIVYRVCKLHIIWQKTHYVKNYSYLGKQYRFPEISVSYRVSIAVFELYATTTLTWVSQNIWNVWHTYLISGHWNKNWVMLTRHYHCPQIYIFCKYVGNAICIGIKLFA